MAAMFRTASVVGAVSLAVAGAAHAGFTPGDLLIEIGSYDGAHYWSSLGAPGSFASIEHISQNRARVIGGWSTGEWDSSWDIQVRHTHGGAGGGVELVVSSLSFVSQEIMFRDLFIRVTANVGAVAGPTAVSGDVSGSFLRQQGIAVPSLTNISSGGPLYFGVIDASFAQPLMAAPFNITSASFTDPTPFGPEGFGMVTPVVGPSVSSTLLINHAFRVTPQDLSTFSSSLRVVPAPGPGALLLACGFVATPRRRR